MYPKYLIDLHVRLRKNKLESVLMIEVQNSFDITSRASQHLINFGLNNDVVNNLNFF